MLHQPFKVGGAGVHLGAETVVTGKPLLATEKTSPELSVLLISVLQSQASVQVYLRDQSLLEKELQNLTLIWTASLNTPSLESLTLPLTTKYLLLV